MVSNILIMKFSLFFVLRNQVLNFGYLIYFQIVFGAKSVTKDHSYPPQIAYYFVDFDCTIWINYLLNTFQKIVTAGGEFGLNLIAILVQHSTNPL